MPAEYGDFFGNLSLYFAASVHGLAVIVKPSCDSCEAVRNGACCAPAKVTRREREVATVGILKEAIRMWL
jgi:hypothetical protein